MSVLSLEANAQNWKALANKADIIANKTAELGNDSSDRNVLREAYETALEDLNAASSIQDSNKKQIDEIRQPILTKLDNLESNNQLLNA